MDWLIEIAKEYGIWAALAVYLTCQNRVDYRGVCKRLNNLEDFMRNSFMDIIKENNSLLEQVKNQLNKKDGK